jgi:hypothetical protein
MKGAEAFSCLAQNGSGSLPDASLFQQQSSGLFTKEVNHDLTTMPRFAVFPNVDPLPGSQGQPPTFNRDGQTDRGECRTNVRGHVIITLGGVPEQRITVWHQSVEESLQVLANLRIRVFLDQ